MKTILCIGILLAAASASAVTITVDGLRQRYPWNGKVDIDYTLTLDAGETLTRTEDDIVFTIRDESVTPAQTYRACAFEQAVFPFEAGKHRVTWMANVDGRTNATARLSATAKVVRYSPQFLVVDLSGGTSASSYPVAYLHGEPVGGFNQSAYKTTKLVMRRVQPGRYNCGRYQRGVCLTRTFWLGVFELTQKQYQSIYNAGSFSGAPGDMRPAYGVIYNNMVGTGWPQKRQPSSDSLCGKLAARTGLAFTLPTEAQWEYACRAGTTTAFNNGTSSIAGLGRYSGNKDDGAGSPLYITHTTVGCYQPNAWGFYDMHGNVDEWCLDWYGDLPVGTIQAVDPVGAPAPYSNAERIARGGSNEADANGCSATARKNCQPGGSWTRYGCRLAICDYEEED